MKTIYLERTDRSVDAIIRRTFIALFQTGLIDKEADDFHTKLRRTAELLGVPAVELWLLHYHACINGDDITRAEIAEWKTWCERYAPQRLAVKQWKGGE